MNRMQSFLSRVCVFVYVLGLFGLLFSEGADFLIITADEFAQTINSLAEWKYMKGIQTKVVMLSEIGPNPDTTAIRNYIVNAYTTWNPQPKYLLLIGDVSRIPYWLRGTPSWVPSDNPYGDMGGPDCKAEIAVGRFAVQTIDACETVVAKTLSYERTPGLQGLDWLQKATIVMREDEDNNEPYWAALQHIYDALFCYGYDPVDTLIAHHDGAGADKYDVIAAIDDGRSFVVYRGSSSGGAWSYPMNVTHDELNNGWKLPIVISGSCGVGNFTQQPAMCNRWTQSGSAENPRGALAFIGPSSTGANVDLSWSRTFATEGIMDAILANHIKVLGDAFVSGKNFMYDYCPPYREQEYYAWSLVGDPTLQICTTIPGEMSVQHPSAVEIGVPNDIMIVVKDASTLEPIQDALVTIYKFGVMGPEIFEKENTDVNGTVVFEDLVVPNIGVMNVTVTYNFEWWNYIPYQGDIQVWQMMTDDVSALAYNGNRHLVRVPSTEELHLVYTRGGEVVYRHSSNAGVDWSLPVSLGNGKYPAIALDCADSLSVTWTDDAGGLWYKRKLSSTNWTDAYHLWNPVDIGDLRLNSPPSIAIDHRSRPNKGHILVTRSGGEPNRDIAHTVEDYTFFITQPLGGSFVLIEQTQSPNLYPPLRSNPSIAQCEVNNSMHATWQRVDTICYAEKPPSQPWINQGAPFGFNGLQSTHPFVETYGDSIYVVWQHLDPSTQKEETYRGRRYTTGPFYSDNLSRTTDLISCYPVNASGFFTAYAEEPTVGSLYEIYYKVRPEDDRRFISNTAYNSLYPQCAARFTLQHTYLYTAWQDGNEAPYEICFKKMEHIETKDMAYLSSPNGDNQPSPYLAARDSFISDWQIPVDIGNTTTAYQFPLIPGYAYKAKVVLYHEGSDPWSGRIKIDNTLQFVVTYNANVPETLECWIPPALYQDSVLTVSFNRISGNFAAIGPIYFYRYEYENGGGPMSQQSQPMYNTSLTVFPNPFTENLNITYQVVGQEGASLRLYDVTGRLVKQFMLPSNVSFNHIIWDGVDDHGRKVPQGVYFLRIDNIDSDGIICQKVLRVK